MKTMKRHLSICSFLNKHGWQILTVWQRKHIFYFSLKITTIVRKALMRYYLIYVLIAITKKSKDKCNKVVMKKGEWFLCTIRGNIMTQHMSFQRTVIYASKRRLYILSSIYLCIFSNIYKYTYICIHVIKINADRVHDFEREQGGIWKV